MPGDSLAPPSGYVQFSPYSLRTGRSVLLRDTLVRAADEAMPVTRACLPREVAGRGFLAIRLPNGYVTKSKAFCGRPRLGWRRVTPDAQAIAR